MRSPAPKKSRENPVASAILGAVMVRRGRETHDPSLMDFGKNLELIAKENEKTPQGPLSRPIRQLQKAMKRPG